MNLRYIQVFCILLPLNRLLFLWLFRSVFGDYEFEEHYFSTSSILLRKTSNVRTKMQWGNYGLSQGGKTQLRGAHWPP